MNEQEVVQLMESSTSEKSWNDNADAVKRACRGYPSFWYTAIVLSGVAERVAATWDGTDEIKIR